jgi:hypothetical protein
LQEDAAGSAGMASAPDRLDNQLSRRTYSSGAAAECQWVPAGLSLAECAASTPRVHSLPFRGDTEWTLLPWLEPAAGAWASSLRSQVHMHASAGGSRLHSCNAVPISTSLPHGDVSARRFRYCCFSIALLMPFVCLTCDSRFLLLLISLVPVRLCCTEHSCTSAQHCGSGAATSRNAPEASDRRPL